MGTMTAAPLVEFKSALAAAPSAAGGVLQDESDPMVFDILGSVTGIVDEVKDVVMPGAFARTLGVRTPKIIKDHDWGQRLGKVLSIRELKPGDPDLPAKLPNGKPWPAAAGALLAKVRLFNSPEGQQAAERWREDPEQQFSIGYIARKAFQRKADKVRALVDVELMEISDVLWGAMPLCGTLNGALATKMLPVGAEAKALGTVDQETADATEAMLHRLAEDEIDWTAVEAAAQADAAAGAVDGDQGDVEVVPDDANPPAGTEPADTDPPAGTEPVDTDVETAADAAAETTDAAADDVEGKAQGGADKNRGNAENLRRWYVHGEGAAKIRWGEDGDFMRCVRIAGKHMGERAKGYCQLRHIDATGKPAGHAAGEGKALLERYGLADDVLYVDPAPVAAAYNPALEVGDFAGAKAADTTVVEVKDYPRLPGTLEERLERIRTACWEALRGAPILRHSDDDEAVPAFGSDVRYSWNHVRVDATYPDRVIATRIRWSMGSPGEDECETFEMAYERDGNDITLGEPSRIQLQVQAVAVPDSDGEYDSPAIGALPMAVKDVTAQLTSATTLEGKAGRVLSSTNSSRLQAALQHLLAVAAAAGIKLEPVDEPETPAKPVPSGTPDSTAPSAQTETKSIPIDVVRAQIELSTT